MVSFKFQTRLTLVYLALFLLVQGGIVAVFYTTVTRNVEAQVSGQLASSARIFERIINTQVEELKSRAGVLARDFGFRQAVGTGDRATIRSALMNLSKRFDADLAIVYDADGKRVVTAGGSPEVDFSKANVVGEDAERLSAQILIADGKLYETVIVPILAPDLIAWIMLGQELDSVAVQEIKDLSPIDLEIAFLYDDGGGFVPTASTDAGGKLTEFLSGAHNNQAGAVFPEKLDDQEYLFWRLDLSSGMDGRTSGNEADALLYYSLEKAFQPYQALAITLSGVLGAGLIVLIIGSFVISRGVTRPLRRLATAARQIAKGDYQEVPTPTKDDEISNLTNSFNQMVAAVKEREDRIVFQAQHDTETGLSNRNYFEQKLRRRLEEGSEFCVALAEVQQVSELRNVLDQSHINQLMRSIGERIEQVAGVEVALLSTDTFVFVLDDPGGADIIASLIMNSFMTPFEVTEIVIDVSIKMGMAKSPGDSAEQMKLMQAASTALDFGRTVTKGFAWYVASNSEVYTQRLSMMSDLRDALKTGEIDFAYQPKLDLAQNKVMSVEALVRWNSKTRGFVAPDDFIPFAERTGDIRHLSEWGLRKAVAQASKWREGGRTVSVAVNLSASDLMNMNLPGQVLALLREYRLPASGLKLEVTESAVMHDMNRALEVLNMLSAMGVTLSIDDYGTGHSSLSYLKRLPVSELKIDKSFVLNLADSEEDRILVRSTIELGHNLGLKVTAEGVEDQQSMDMLKEYGCDTLQGYFISRPVPAADLERFLGERGE